MSVKIDEMLNSRMKLKKMIQYEKPKAKVNSNNSENKLISSNCDSTLSASILNNSNLPK